MSSPTSRSPTVKIVYGELSDSTLVHVANYNSEQGLVHCIGCGDQLVARRGSIRQWHFAHKVSACAIGEGLLHLTAKRLIAQRFRQAKANGEEYRLAFPCPACRHGNSADLTALATLVDVEAAPCAHVRADLLFSGGRRDFAVEVVVSHDIEDVTRQRYTEAGVPVFSVHPSWDTLESLQHSLSAQRATGTDTTKCPSCRAEAKRIQVIETALSAIVTPRPVRRWGTASSGVRLDEWVLDELEAHGKKLSALGFVQSAAKPWLFVYRLSKDDCAFANMGGTAEVPIWKDRRPMLHWQLAKPSDRAARALARRFLLTCRDAGVPMRLSFHDQHHYPADFDPGPTPGMRRVSIAEFMTGFRGW